jgi:23S rRNA (cytosine1962-C5)-methyltransferase
MAPAHTAGSPAHTAGSPAHAAGSPPKPASLILKPKRDAAVERRHPWVFSGAISRIVAGDTEPGKGDMVAIRGPKGGFLAWGHYSPESQIRARLFSWEEGGEPDSAPFWRRRIARALDLRRELLASPTTTACRLIFGESDGVPGLIVDRYADVLVAQFLTAGADARRELFADLVWEEVQQRLPGGRGVATLFERSDADVRDREDLPERTGLLRGEEPPDRIEIREHGLAFQVDVRSGHKTGFYLDQRDNRQSLYRVVAERVALGETPTVLNVFAYTGGFGVYALAAGAGAVTHVDTSTDALNVALDNHHLNNQDMGRVEQVAGDAFQVLRSFRQKGRRFDAIVLDPPKFAFTQRDVNKASRGYKDINFQALHLLKPGGLLFTFSCSGAISEDLFQKIVFGAALDAGRDVQIVGRMMQAGDHPVMLSFPEGAYLKGLICRAMD